MTIFKNNLKRILRKKFNWLFLFIVPAALTAFISGMSGDSPMIRVGVVDYDNTVFTQGLVQSLEARSRVSMIEESDIQKGIFGQTLDLAILIDENFTEDILQARPGRIKTMGLEETDKSNALKMHLDSYVNAALQIAEASGGETSRFYEGLEAFEQGVFSIRYTTVERRGAERGSRVSQMGFLVMSMLFMAGFSSSIMLEDKEKKVYYRVISGPLSVPRFMIENLLSFYAVCMIQIFLTFSFMRWFLGVDFGPDLLPMLMVSLIFSFTAVALGVAVNTLAKDMRQAGVFMSLLITPMCMLGGCWWPIEMMPDVLQRIGQFVPTTWIMQAYSKIIYGGGLLNAVNEILVLSAFTVVFLLFATWRRTDFAQ